MENKNVGWLIIGISAIIVVIIFLFNSSLREFVSSSCTLAHGGTYCPMYDTITKQTILALGIVGILIIFGIALIFTKPKEKIIVKKFQEKKKKINLEGLERDERKVIELLRHENGGMFQATLMEKLEIGKVKATRLLDKLESKGLVERKRRGMNNIIVLKN
ncbi:MAG: MarR family transcriptional regulator [Nanoarchaeota archaeon]